MKKIGNIERIWKQLANDDPRLANHPMLAIDDWERKAVPIILHLDAATFTKNQNAILAVMQGVSLLQSTNFGSQLTTLPRLSWSSLAVVPPSILLSPSSTPHVQPLEDSLCLMQEWFGRERRLLRVTDLVNSMTPSQRRHRATWLGIRALLIHSHSPYMVLPNMFPFPTPVFPTPSLDLHWMLRLRLPWLPLS